MYLDTAYLAKFYLDEPESPRLRKLVMESSQVHSAQLAIAEFHAVLHRHVRECRFTAADARDLALRFSEHVASGFWKLAPVNEALLRRTAAILISAPPELFIRTADAIHLTAAQDLGEREVWTNDRHMLAAAPYFGLAGRSV